MEIKDNVLTEVTDNDINIDGTFVIPNGITKIGYVAFEDCTSLTSLTIPNSVTTIEDSAFEGCTSLTSLTIPNSVTTIEDYAFEGCTGLTSLTIPKSVTTIGMYAFKGCTSLTSLTITIGQGAFEGCTSLSSITIPDSVIRIGQGAFSGCTSLTSLTVPESVTIIGDSAFSGCTSLTSITIPESVTIIGDSAFLGCLNLTSIAIPNSVTTVREYTFEDCTSLTSLTISENVTAIGYSAFEYCISLTSVTIPNSVTTIGPYAFSKCKNLNLDIKTSLFYINKEYINETFDVNKLTIYNTKVDLDNIENSLREIREEELQDKINYALLDNYISDPKCFKLSEHKKFINKIINNIETVENYDYRPDFDNYITNYINENKPKELVEIKNIQSMLIDINNYNIDNKGLNNSTALEQYGIELLDYSFYISSLLSKLQTNSTNDIATLNLNKILSKITKLQSRNPDDISKLVEKVFFNVTEEGLVLNKTLMNKMISYTRYKVCSLNDEINGFEILKEIIRICIEKINVCKENLNNIEITDERDIRLLNIDNNSIKSNANEKIDAFNNCELMLSIYNERINNFITLNQIHIDKLKELVTQAIPSLLQKVSSNKVVLKDKEDVEILNKVCNTLRELIKSEESSKIETNSLEILTEGKEKTYKK